MRGREAQDDPLPPSPVVTTCFGHAGIGIGSEAFRQTLLEVGADPKAPTLDQNEDESRILERYGTTVMRLGDPSPGSTETPLIPRALLCDLDPRSSNLILQSYPELFRLRDKHVVTGKGGAARNWAKGRERFRNEITAENDFADHLKSLAPEEARGYQVPFAMGGGTGSSFACTFLEHVEEKGTGNETVATVGLLPDFGYDPVIYGTACINITMNLDYQIRYSDCPILIDNGKLRDLAHIYDDNLSRQSSIVDDLQTREQEVAWQEYREMNLVAARFMSMFTASFTRETEWDFSNYRTWLSQKPKFVIPWLIPVVPEEGGFLSKPDASVEGLVRAIEEGHDSLLYDFEGEMPEGGRRDAACVLVKVKGEFGRDDRQMLKDVITDRFPSINERRIIFVRIPCVEHEPASACVLVNTKSIKPKLMEFVEEAEAVWDDYKPEYVEAGLEEEEFKESVVRVINHFE
jgi:tubulin gamma